MESVVGLLLFMIIIKVMYLLFNFSVFKTYWTISSLTMTYDAGLKFGSIKPRSIGGILLLRSLRSLFFFYHHVAYQETQIF